KIIVVVNKIDRSDARVHYVLDKTLDLFFELGADDNTADFPIVYASAKNGIASLNEDVKEVSDISALFEIILKEVPPPFGSSEKPLQMQVSNLTYDQHKGRIAIGKIYNGKLSQNQEVIHIDRTNNHSTYKITSLMSFNGLERVDIEEAFAGDIVAISGVNEINIGETIA